MQSVLLLVLLGPNLQGPTTFSDVHPVFVTRCSACHSVAGFGGFDIANTNIASAYFDSQLPSYYSPGQTKGFASVQRMLDGTMPLSGGCSGDPLQDAGNPACASAAEYALLQAWLQDGQLGPVPSTGTSYCFGDGSTTPCPCNNHGLSFAGCAHVASSLGARLVGRGTASLAADTLLLEATRLPDSSALFLQGTLQQAIAFGDGLLCLSGTLVRLGTRIPSGGLAQFPGPGDSAISVRGAVPAPGSLRHYQVLFRNPGLYCQPANQSLSNALSIVWTL